MSAPRRRGSGCRTPRSSATCSRRTSMSSRATSASDSSSRASATGRRRYRRQYTSLGGVPRAEYDSCTRRHPRDPASRCERARVDAHVGRWKTAPPPAVLWVMTAGYVTIPLPRRPALAQSTVAAVAAALVVAALAAAGAGTALLLPRSAAPPNTTMLTPITTTTAPGSAAHEQATDR